jgi:hypothetical protein
LLGAGVSTRTVEELDRNDDDRSTLRAMSLAERGWRAVL